MKKLILLFVFLFGITKTHAQTSIPEVGNPNGSIGGMFENTFDHYGNKYTLSDIRTDTPKRSKINNQLKTSTLLCTSGFFELYFESGSGMESATDPVHIARRNVVCRVFNDLSSFINSPLKDAGNSNKVRIWIRDINEVYPSTTNVLGLATAYYTMPKYDQYYFGGIVDNEIWKTIHLGKDSYINVASPLYNSSTNTVQSGLFYHGMMAFNFNNSSLINWNTNLSTNCPAGLYDLYTVVLHEVTHALGFASLINSNGKSKFGTGFKYYSRYDRFLKNNNNTLPLITSSNSSCSMYNYDFNTSLSTSILFPGSPPCITQQTSCSNAIKYVGTSAIPVYTPNCFESASSLSHFEDQCIGSPNGNNTNAYFVMTDANGTGVTKRFLKPEERNTLGDIGYRLNITYGNNTTALNSYKNYGGSITTGVLVAGTNDGINSNGTFMYIVNPNTNINITNILSNDKFATGFECLEDIYSTSTISPTSAVGINANNIVFNSTIGGLHLLRYIPTSGTQKGNITYIYVYVKTNNECTTPTVCNLVNNGNFEQYSSLPDGVGQIEKACGWSRTHFADGPFIATPDFHHRNSTVNYTDIPCNSFGYQDDNLLLNGYAGIAMLESSTISNGSITEVIATKLNNTLMPNTNYQLSFDVSLADRSAPVSIKFQAYLEPHHSRITTVDANYEIPITHPTLFFENLSYSTNFIGWDKIVFNFTTGATTNDSYFLYLGGLNKIDFGYSSPIIPVNCSSSYQGSDAIAYYYVDNVSLIPTNVTFNLPTTICQSQILSNLNNYLSVQIPSGVFSGNGVTLSNGIYSFNGNTAGLGAKTITYTYTNNLGCLVNVYSNITVSDCSSTSCPGNLIFDYPQTISSASYQAANSIITNTNYIVNAGSTINLKAGNSITFSPMSEIKSGSTSNFIAQIAQCTQTSARITNESNEIKENIDVQIYPNPFDKIFNIKITGDELSKITLLTLEGKIIYNVPNIQSNFYNIESDSLQKGIYIVYIETKNGLTFNKKIIKN